MGPPAMATDGGFYGHPMGAPYGGEPIEPTPAGGPWGEPTGPLVEPATPDAARDPSARRLPQGAHRGHAPVAARPTSTPGLIGPIGYDVHK